MQRGHDRLSTYAIGADRQREEWQGLIRQLIHRGYLTQDIARYSVLRLTAAAEPLLAGDETLELARPRVRPPAQPRTRAARAGRRDGTPARAARDDGPDWFTGGAPERLLDVDDEAGEEALVVDERLLARLKALRRRLADARRVPAYVVFNDATLAEMAAFKPVDDESFLAVNGVGQKKLEQFGEAFQAEIRDHLSLSG